MTRIFISYRREDSRKDAGRIYDRLVETFGRENVFKDVDNIPLGADFRGVLREAVAKCDVLLAIIGKKWLTIEDEHGNRRLDNPNDFVRLEVVSALQRQGLIVIPVLIDHASMPRSNDLPDDLRELAYKNATVVRDDPDFNNDISRLIRSLESHLSVSNQSFTSANSSVPPIKSSRWGLAALGFIIVAAIIAVALGVLSSRMDSNGDVLVTMLPSPEATLTAVALDNEQSQIVFYRRTRISENNDRYSLYIARLEGDEWTTEPLLEADDKDFYSNSPSPDGTKIAYFSNQDGVTNIWLINTDGTGEPTQLTNDSGFNIWAGLTWSPDSKSIAFIKSVDGVAQLHMLDIDAPADTLTQLTDGATDSHTLDWSPEPTEGRYIVYARTVEQETNAAEEAETIRNLWIYDFETETNSVLIQSDLDTWNPAWSPDGQSLAYTSDVREDAPCEIFRLALQFEDDGTVSTGTPTRLTENEACDWYPDYSPDGTQIAYFSNEIHAIRVMNSQKGEMSEFENVNDHSGDNSISDSWPRWIPPQTASG